MSSLERPHLNQPMRPVRILRHQHLLPGMEGPSMTGNAFATMRLWQHLDMMFQQTSLGAL